MYDPNTLYTQALEHQERLHREAERRRLARQAHEDGLRMRFPWLFFRRHEG